MGILEFSASFRGSKATEARNSKFLVILGLDPRISIRTSKIYYDEIPRSSRGMTQGLENSRLGILEFSVSLRGSKATEAISRNSL